MCVSKNVLGNVKQKSGQCLSGFLLLVPGSDKKWGSFEENIFVLMHFNSIKKLTALEIIW